MRACVISSMHLHGALLREDPVAFTNWGSLTQENI